MRVIYWLSWRKWQILFFPPFIYSWPSTCLDIISWTNSPSVIEVSLANINTVLNHHYCNYEIPFSLIDSDKSREKSFQRWWAKVYQLEICWSNCLSGRGSFFKNNWRLARVRGKQKKNNPRSETFHFDLRPKKALNLYYYQNIFQFGPLTVATGEKRRVAIAREGNLLRVALL